MPFDPNKSDPIVFSDAQRQSVSLGGPLNPVANTINSNITKSSNIGLFIALFFSLAPVFVIGFFVYDGFFAADLNPKAIHGNFADGTIIPAGENAGKLYFIMDDSFYFTSEVSTPGRHSISTESLFNKTYSYVYDAPKGEVLERTKNMYGSKAPSFHVFALGDSIWSVGDVMSNESPDLRVLDTTTNKEVLNLQGFVDKFPELKSGVYRMQFFDDKLFYKHISIKTLDGSSFEYYPEFDRLAASTYELKNWLYVNKYDDMSKETTGWVLRGSDRKDLHLVKGIKALVMSAVEGQNKDQYVDSVYSDEFEKRNGANAERPVITATQVATDVAFLNGEILYQDSDVVLILHQVDARDLSPKMVTLVHKDKGVAWTVNEDKLLPKMRTNPNDTFTSMFFIKDEFSAERVKDSLMLKFKQGGVVAFDISTGNILWTFNPNRGWFE